ncbi:MAG: GLPGLI family protein [Reichenbachiella sp.]|uniref:GLPGLI family protein n=1 Tax=Reichenbachiella sp. TaxID=2184521 RepID=UPI003266A25B
MKKLIILMGVIMPFVSLSQNQGSVVFEEKRKLELDFDGPNGQAIKSRMPESISAKNQLLFNNEYSIFRSYKDKAAEDVEMLNQEQDGGMVINIKRPESFVFRDLGKKEVVESREFFGKQFLISRSKPNPWKIFPEKRTILGYQCQKAMLVIEEGEEAVSAWFALIIPVSTGPATYGGLPGMILLLDIGEGRMTYSAVEIQTETVDQSLLKAPKNGKKVSREEFQEIVEKRMAEQKEISGNGGMMIRRIERQ